MHACKNAAEACGPVRPLPVILLGVALTYEVSCMQNAGNKPYVQGRPPEPPVASSVLVMVYIVL
jgi:hypothetical protein